MEIMPHLKLSDELNIKYAILPGDTARVDRIAEQLEAVSYTHLDVYKRQEQ